MNKISVKLIIYFYYNTDFDSFFLAFPWRKLRTQIVFYFNREF